MTYKLLNLEKPFVSVVRDVSWSKVMEEFNLALFYLCKD